MSEPFSEEKSVFEFTISVSGSIQLQITLAELHKPLKQTLKQTSALNSGNAAEFVITATSALHLQSPNALCLLLSTNYGLPAQLAAVKYTFCLVFRITACKQLTGSMS